MASYEYELTDRPSEDRAAELWLQHAAGFIFFQDVRQYAIEQIDPGVSAETRAAVQKGIDDALYGLMMVIDGVSGSLRNQKEMVEMNVVVRHLKREEIGDDMVVREIKLKEGDGMCMGYHGWLEGDFGSNPPAKTPAG